jgi:hypothetical protein
VREEVEELKKELNEVKEQSLAMEILKEQKKNNKRLFIALIVVLCMWLATIGAFLYYINTTDYVEVEEIADTCEGGNACVGDSCNNGEINYGKGN